MKPVKPDPQLAEIIGHEPIPRTDVIRKLWDYIRGNNLQDPENKTFMGLLQNKWVEFEVRAQFEPVLTGILGVL
jgi:chromatin remodeling complex protein RSC6